MPDYVKDGAYGGTFGKNSGVERLPGYTQMVTQHALQQRPHIHRRHQVPPLEERLLAHPRPIGNNLAAINSTACNERSAAIAMIGSKRTIGPGRAAEFGCGDDNSLPPSGSKAYLNPFKRS